MSEIKDMIFSEEKNPFSLVNICHGTKHNHVWGIHIAVCKKSELHEVVKSSPMWEITGIRQHKLARATGATAMMPLDLRNR